MNMDVHMFAKSYLNKGGSSIIVIQGWTPASLVLAPRVVESSELWIVSCIPGTRCSHVVTWQRVGSIDEKAFFNAAWSCRRRIRTALFIIHLWILTNKKTVWCLQRKKSFYYIFWKQLHWDLILYNKGISFSKKDYQYILDSNCFLFKKLRALIKTR